jgi:hypothetical protein
MFPIFAHALAASAIEELAQAGSHGLSSRR